MPTSTETIRNEYPLPVYNYRVEIGGEAIAFTEVSGLTIGYEVGTHKESPISKQAGPRTFHFPTQRSDVNITLKKGLIKSISMKILYGWIQTVQTNQVEKRDVFIRLCDEKGDAVISWKVLNAFPTKLTAPTFDAKSNDAAIETLELRADLIMMEAS